MWCGEESGQAATFLGPHRQPGLPSPPKLTVHHAERNDAVRYDREVGLVSSWEGLRAIIDESSHPPQLTTCWLPSDQAWRARGGW